MDAKLCSGLDLAYIGDAYYELIVRNHFINSGITKVNDLRKKVIKYTCAEHQSKVIKYFIKENMLSQEEISMFKRGRNSNTNKTRKTLSKEDYNNATGFESLIGYLYMSNMLDRALELILASLAYE